MESSSQFPVLSSQWLSGDRVSFADGEAEGKDALGADWTWQKHFALAGAEGRVGIPFGFAQGKLSTQPALRIREALAGLKITT